MGRVCVVRLHSRSVRRVLGQVSAEVKRHWPEMHVQAVANLFFLRFLSPALVAAGVNAGGSGGGQHRVLMLVSKCVYSLMNGIPFGDKESYMASMNTFISPQNLALVQSFMRELVVCYTPQPSASPMIALLVVVGCWFV
jgi:hypothetical protein